MMLKLDYDIGLWPTLKSILDRHRYIKSAVLDLGWKVDVPSIKVYRSSSGKGRHVELHMTFPPMDPYDAEMGKTWVPLIQSIMGSDPRRELWIISRIISVKRCPEFQNINNVNILWDEKNGKKRRFDEYGTRLLRRVWR